jgi:hypothetical protein
VRKLGLGVIDLVSKGPMKALYARVMNANPASIMPQVVDALPDVYAWQVMRDPGPLCHWLREGALRHDHLASLNALEPARSSLASLAANPARAL